MEKEYVNLRRSTVVTTIVAIVILSLALTTATFAWFSSSNRVTASINEFTATSEGGSLEIYWYQQSLEDSNGEEIEMTAPDTLGPMAPIARPVAWTGDNSATATNLTTFLGGFVTAAYRGDRVFDTDGNPATPYRTQFVTGASGAEETYNYIEIVAGSDITTGINVNAVFSDLSLGSGASGSFLDNDKRARVSVFQRAGDLDGNGLVDDDDFLYIGTLGHSGASEEWRNIAYGAITAGVGLDQYEADYLATPWTTQGYVGFVFPGTDPVKLAAQGKVQVVCVVWFDGYLLEVQRGAGGTASIRMTFSIAS